MAIHKELFGTLQDGRSVHAYTLTNHSDVSLRVMDLGATVLNLWIRGVDGNQTDVVCGYDSPLDYLACGGYQGAVIGRVANRIAGASFVLDGRTYNLYPNEGGNHLHGGQYGFDRRMWNCEIQDSDAEPSLVMKYESADGEEGYPGKMIVTVTYILKDNSVIIDYKATTSRPTYCNLTNHSYFNLHGIDSPSILGHELKINADTTTAIDPDTLLPIGGRPDVEGTAFDFRTPKAVGRDYENTGLAYPGYDHNFVLDHKTKEIYKGMELNVAAVCSVPEREMTVLTSKPCVQLYTGNFLGKGRDFKNGIKQKQYQALCLETQYEPDSPSVGLARLDPGEVYHHVTVYRFK